MTRGSGPDCSVLVVWDLHEVALAGGPSVGRGDPVLPGLTDALRTHGTIARRMQQGA
ncbi:hypothetical protein [Streptomyces canus]|uniref:hypothetical protein n=1 Tax=Streptomyces canus TaxID=58343 RepID=UPI000B29CEE2|nr:hypothetical protein [Streptomyces canus]